MRYSSVNGVAGSNALDGLAAGALAIVRMDPLRPLLARRARGPAEEIVDLRAHEEVREARVRRVDVRDDRELLDQRPVAVLDLRGAGLRLLLRVMSTIRPIQCAALPFDASTCTASSRTQITRSARDDQAVLLEIRFRRRVRRDIGDLHPFAIVRMDEGVPERRETR